MPRKKEKPLRKLGLFLFTGLKHQPGLSHPAFRLPDLYGILQPSLLDYTIYSKICAHYGTSH